MTGAGIHASGHDGTQGLQRSPATSAAMAQVRFSPVAPPIVHRVLNSPGQPLEDGLRQTMESGLNHDFGRVRIHSGPEAAQSADAVGADAYTVGSDIVLGGVPAHGSALRRVLAHELTHVVHQAGSPAGAHTAGPFPSGRPTILTSKKQVA